MILLLSPSSTVDLLHIVRIDHGNNSLQDESLVREIVKRDLALTVCPMSNLALKVVQDLREHPLKKMMSLGMKVTVNSDDPAYFGGQVNQNFMAIQRALDLSKEDLCELARNSFQYSLLDQKTKNSFLSEVENYCAD